MTIKGETTRFCAVKVRCSTGFVFDRVVTGSVDDEVEDTRKLGVSRISSVRNLKNLPTHPPSHIRPKKG